MFGHISQQHLPSFNLFNHLFLPTSLFHASHPNLFYVSCASLIALGGLINWLFDVTLIISFSFSALLVNEHLLSSSFLRWFLLMIAFVGSSIFPFQFLLKLESESGKFSIYFHCSFQNFQICFSFF